MSIKKQPKKLVSEKILPSSVLDENTEALDLYKETDDILKETADIIKKADIAMGRKQAYRYIFSSTKNSEINRHAIPPTTASYKV